MAVLGYDIINGSVEALSFNEWAGFFLSPWVATFYFKKFVFYIEIIVTV